MLPDIPFELLFVAIIALIVVGPKDLPILLRKVGQFVAKMRGLAAEFRSSFEELARQSELDELRKEVEALKNARIEPSLIERDIQAELGDLNHDLNFNPNLIDASANTADPHAAPYAEMPPEFQGFPPEKPKRARAKPKAAVQPKAASTSKIVTGGPAASKGAKIVTGGPKAKTVKTAKAGSKRAAESAG